MLFLAPLFSDLPKAVLAAVIIDAVVFGMIERPGDASVLQGEAIRLLDRDRRPHPRADIRVLAGVVIGIVLSIIWLVHVSTRPNIVELGNQPGTQVFGDLASYPEGIAFPGVAVLRFDGGLFFATADALRIIYEIRCSSGNLRSARSSSIAAV